MDTKRAIHNYIEERINSAKQESMQLHETMVWVKLLIYLMKFMI